MRLWQTDGTIGGTVNLGVEPRSTDWVTDPAPRIGGYGLQGMTERADLIGASVQVTSAPQDGTTVSVEVPLEREPEPVRGPDAA